MKKLILILLSALSSMSLMAWAGDSEPSCEATTDVQTKEIKEGASAATPAQPEGTQADKVE